MSERAEGKEGTFEVVGKTLDAVDALTEAVRNSEHAFHWKKLREYAEGLFTRAPFQVGDRVRLTKTPEITEKKAWGWLGGKHFLVKGAMATVKHVDFWDGHFNAMLIFDDESWIDYQGVEHPRDRPSLYTFWETGIERVTDDSSKAEG